MLRADELTITTLGNDVVLRWSFPQGNFIFSAYSDAAADGNFTTLVGTTTKTSYTITGGMGNGNRLFFIVKVRTP